MVLTPAALSLDRGLTAAVESSAEGDDMPARKVILKAYGAQRLVADASQQEVEGRLGFIFPTEAEEAEAIAAAARVRALQLQLTDAFKLLTSTQTVHPVVTNKPRPNSRAHNGAEVGTLIHGGVPLLRLRSTWSGVCVDSNHSALFLEAPQTLPQAKMDRMHRGGEWKMQLVALP
eukprot:gene4205-5181_t